MKRIVIVGLAIAALIVGSLIFVQSGVDSKVATAQPEEQSIETVQGTSRIERRDTCALWPTEPVMETPDPTNWLARMQAGDYPSLSSEEAEAYVAASKRSAESLLAAYRASTDRTFFA